MIIGPSVYDSGALGTNRPDLKSFLIGQHQQYTPYFFVLFSKGIYKCLIEIMTKLYFIFKITDLWFKSECKMMMRGVGNKCLLLWFVIILCSGKT